MAQETLTLKLVAQDLMSGNISKAIGSIDKLSRQSGLAGWAVKGMAISMGAMLNPAALVAKGIGVVTDALGESATAYREDQASQEKLKSALMANIGAWDGNTDAIERVIASRMRLGFSDDEQRDSLAVLVAQVGDVSDALDIQRTAMDLARLKGTSLSESATILAKAYNGSTTSLQRMGIQLAAGTRGIDAVRAVQQRAAGQAEAWGDTSAGAAQAFNLRVGEMQEKVGAFVDGASRQFLGFLSGVVDVLDGPDGASANIRDLSGEILTLRSNVDAIAQQASPFETLAKDLEAWNVQLQNANVAYDPTTFDWLNRLGPDTLRLFGKATAETTADVAGLARGVQDAGGDFNDFAAIVRRKVAPGFNVLTSTWGATMKTIEKQTRRTAQRVPGIAWNIPMGIVDKLREGIPSVESAMTDLTWAIDHPLEETKVRAAIQAALTGEKMAQGIRSKNPAVRQAAIDTRAALLRQWNGLPARAMELGRLTIAQLIAGLNHGERYALGVYGRTGTANQPGGNTPGRAAGGPVSAGGTYLVGERGPELLHMGANSGSITPNHAIRGGDVHVHFHGLVTAPSEAEGQRLARTIAPHLRREMARSGR